MKPFALALTLTLSGFAASAFATNLKVPEEYPTISAAVGVAADGDTVLIGPGIYQEHIDTGNRWVAFIGLFGSAGTIVDGGGSGRPFRLGRGGYLKGLTIQRGFAEFAGGVFATGVTGSGGSGPFLMEDCVLSENSAGGFDAGSGGALAVDVFIIGPTVRRCVFKNNAAGDEGGAVYTVRSTLFENCEFSGNHAGNFGGGISGAGTRVQRSLFVHNTAGSAGGAIEGTIFEITNNTMVDNRHNNFFAVGAAIHIRRGSGVVANNIVANSRGRSGANAGVGIYCTSDIHVTLRCNDSWGNDGPNFVIATNCDTIAANNFSADPQFCSPQTEDYTLRSTSPCAGSSGPCGQVGLYGVGCQAISIEQTTWSRIKTLLR